MDIALNRIESILRDLTRAVQRIAEHLERPAREAMLAGDPTVYAADLNHVVARLRARYDLQILVADVGQLSRALRRLGYEVPLPGPMSGMRSCQVVWREDALPRLVRDVSYRLFAETARPDPTPEQVRLAVRALTGTYGDMERVQQILSADGRSHHDGIPADEDDVTFECWSWRRSRELYAR